jgi:DNA invertase Pin-like site-specific DNA recombinase
MKNFIVYYRVSTRQQGQSGLGLEAQKAAVEHYLNAQGATEIPPSFTEIESGANNHRPQLLKAIARCKTTGATLLIAKLDRLSRNTAFILLLKQELEQAGVGFIACDMPDANHMTIGIMAVLAQEERELISRRTKEGLQAAKARGQRLGSPANLTDESRRRSAEVRSRQSLDNPANQRAYAMAATLRDDLKWSFSRIATHLNTNGFPTARQGRWHGASVRNLYQRFKQHK